MEHGGSTGVNLEKKSLSPRCTLPCQGTTDASAVEDKKPRMVNFGSGDPQIQAALLRQAGLYCSGQKTSIATRGTAIMIRKQNCNTQPGRRKEQRFSGSTEENGNRTEETQHEPSESPPNIGVGQEIGK